MRLTTPKSDRSKFIDGTGACPKFDFRPKKSTNEPTDGFDYGDDGYDPNK